MTDCDREARLMHAVEAGANTGTDSGGSQQQMPPLVGHEYEPLMAFGGSKCKWCGHIWGAQDHGCGNVFQRRLNGQ